MVCCEGVCGLSQLSNGEFFPVSSQGCVSELGSLLTPSVFNSVAQGSPGDSEGLAQQVSLLPMSCVWSFRLGSECTPPFLF